MRTPSTILRNLSLRRIQPRVPVAAVAPLPETTQFNRALTVELDTLQSQGIGVSELGLDQLLDAAINTQKIALDSLVKVSYRDDVDHGAMEEYLERNIDILDACNYFVERIENMKKYVDSLRVVARLVDSDAMASARALDQLKSCHDIEKKCKAMGKHGLCLMRRMLRQKLSHHHESEFSEIVCGSNAMALKGCRFLELGLSFDDSKHGLPMMKQCQHHTMNELAGQAEGSAEKKLKRRRSGSFMMNELHQMVIAARELKEQMKGKREKEMIKSSVERLKKNCRELEDGLDFIEGRVKDLYKSLIDVRMVLLGILSHA
ncbi:uncharacterized protein LOC133294827 [Gastrolobium bilobum]|uniref:uncharacterized protein LOC133294827 n=1 Tax=Gastrolobium bilobum TaxID=150636 RepID=UPI002AB2EE90|nr:uncharacterized protein LOC133294827 [Gastrolobium bilobum]